MLFFTTVNDHRGRLVRWNQIASGGLIALVIDEDLLRQEIPDEVYR